MMRDAPFLRLTQPAPIALKGRRVLVLGLGDTGLSAARWVERQGATARVADTRQTPPQAARFSGDLRTGPFTAALLDDVDLLCISPGLALTDPLVAQAGEKGIPVVGDVELFAWENTAPVLAVTGTNGKTTVASLTGHLLRASGVDCEVAGNIAPPVLDALSRREKAPAVWVLELSSYQLETTWSLAPHAAVMLNLSQDHLDRYASLDDYAAAKARVFQGDGTQIVNRDDARSFAMRRSGRTLVSFGLDDKADFGLKEGTLREGNRPIVRADALQVHGAHNVSNALAACALARSIGIPHESLAQGLRTFRGLPHRVELISSRRGVDWYDDSKGTNVGAAVAALRGLNRRTVLILGGDGKGQDFSPLAAPARDLSKRILLIGRDAPRIEKLLSGLPVERCESLEHAVARAAEIATAGDVVLLSPACASFDMFRDYRHRGEAFCAAVRKLPA